MLGKVGSWTLGLAGKEKGEVASLKMLRRVWGSSSLSEATGSEEPGFEPGTSGVCGTRPLHLHNATCTGVAECLSKGT